MNKELKFDRARFDAGEMPTRTRDGRRVLHVHDSGLDVEWPIVAWVEGSAFPNIYTSGGSPFKSGRENALGLVHEPRVRNLKVVVYLHQSTGEIYVVTSDHHDDFEAFVDRVSRAGRLLQLLEVEVPA